MTFVTPANAVVTATLNMNLALGDEKKFPIVVEKVNRVAIRKIVVANTNLRKMRFFVEKISANRL